MINFPIQHLFIVIPYGVNAVISEVCTPTTKVLNVQETDRKLKIVCGIRNL